MLHICISGTDSVVYIYPLPYSIYITYQYILYIFILTQPNTTKQEIKTS